MNKKAGIFSSIINMITFPIRFLLKIAPPLPRRRLKAKEIGKGEENRKFEIFLKKANKRLKNISTSIIKIKKGDVAETEDVLRDVEALELHYYANLDFTIEKLIGSITSERIEYTTGEVRPGYKEVWERILKYQDEQVSQSKELYERATYLKNLITSKEQVLRVSKKGVKKSKEETEVEVKEKETEIEGIEKSAEEIENEIKEQKEILEK